ncbi:ArsB/NhaD family transporter [Pseudothermotoga sp.]|nr:SLC13 family permease [Pseudothermotoga sp.]MCX7813011.1 SLC13 family permease [Pseudothermotoga sp.]MDW8139750.1 SLC13 family permease [Pseudothermotoga sp.]
MIKQLIALGLFLGAYYVILSKTQRTSVKVFLLGLIAAVLKLSEGLTVENISRVVDFNTIGLLLGMMIIVAVMKTTGFFQMAAIYAVRLGRGQLKRTFLMLMIFIAVLSAFLDNVTTLLIFAPILFLVCDAAGVDPSRMLVLGIVASNIGGISTMIGDPPNIIIGLAGGLSFTSFITHLAPAAFLLTLISALLLTRDIHEEKESLEGLRKLATTNPIQAITDKKTLSKLIVVFVVTIVGFAFHERLKIDIAFIALVGASLSLILAGKNFEDVAKEVEWDTLFFFMGLFSLTYVVRELGLLSKFAGLVSLIRSPLLLTLLLVWLGAIMSALLSAVPTTVVLVPVVKHLVELGHPIQLWWAIALGIGIGSNTTPMGAAVNIVAISLLKKFTGKTLMFKDFFKVSSLIVLIGLMVSSLYALLLSFSGW